MNAPVFTSTQVKEFMKATFVLYDIVRLVDPGECRILYIPETSEQRVSKDCRRCFDVWGQTERCWNCSSYNAALSGRIEEKIESLDGKAYRIVSVPLLIKDDDEQPRSACIEFIKLLKNGETPDIKPAVPEDLYEYESVTTVEDTVLRLMEAAGRRTNTGIVCYDKDGNCIHANEAAFRLFRIRNDLEQMKLFLNEWNELNFQEKSGRRWVRMLETDGMQRAIEIEHFLIHEADGSLLGSYHSYQDITPLTASENMLHFQKIHDSLTGLYNWDGFREKAQERITHPGKSSLLLIQINIKDFKLVNQLFGSEKGDDVLRSIAKMCREASQEDDIICRVIADHFAILTSAEHFDKEGFAKRSQQLSDQFGNNLYKLRIQFGIYRLSDRREDLSIMLDRTKMAIQSIRDDQPVLFQEYNSTIILNALYESEVINSFEDALRNEELHIFLQSQNDRQGNIVSAEALARWIHPEQGIIPPDRFIGILERAGRIHELDQYIWDKAARLLKQWSGTSREHLGISVNISPKDIASLDLEKVFTELVRKYEISPKRLHLEITETAVIANPQACIQLVQDLQKAGFTIEIDDFGSGYSSLNLLKDLRANVLKIDRAFLQKTQQEKRSEIILMHIINMAKDLDMGVITEGVETEMQLDMLYTLGCKLFQGYYFSKPLPIGEFEKKYF